MNKGTLLNICVCRHGLDFIKRVCGGTYFITKGHNSLIFLQIFSKICLKKNDFHWHQFEGENYISSTTRLHSNSVFKRPTVVCNCPCLSPISDVRHSLTTHDSRRPRPSTEPVGSPVGWIGRLDSYPSPKILPPIFFLNDLP